MKFITGNKNKFEEVASMIPGLEQLDIDLDEIQELDPHIIIKHKLKEAMVSQEGVFIVEDTSLYVDSMNGLPGPLIKWFLNAIGVDKLFSLLNALGPTRATAKTVIGYCDDGKIKYFEGSLHGSIVAPRGHRDFGWDPLFLPDGHDKTLAEMDASKKNSLSHRHLAVSALKSFIDQDSR